MKDVVTICKETVECLFCGRKVYKGEKVNLFDFSNHKHYYCSECVKNLFDIDLEKIEMGDKDECNLST